MNRIKSVLFTLIGAMILSFAISVFLTPNKIVSGGFGGVSTILYTMLNIPQGVTFFTANIILLIFGMKILGKEFIIKTLIGSGLVSIFTQAFSCLPAATENVILASIFGGTLYGLGIGICLAVGSSSGGTDILGRMLQYKFPHLPIGKLLLLVDGTIIFISFLAFKKVELALYGIISLFVSTYSVDWLIRKLNVSKIAFVVTEKGEEVSKLLVSTSSRGVTLLNGVGAYTTEKKKVLFCALKESEIEKFQQKVTSVDKDAFIVYSEAQKIKGKGFYIYR